MINFSNLSPTVQAGLISAIVALVTTILSLLTKSWIEKRIHINKLETEHKYEQQKGLKTLLAKNKMQLLNISEQLNHRLWNFIENCDEHWLDVNGNYKHGNYFKSFVYRFVAFFAYIRKIENELIYIDSTFATKKDLEFIKFLRTFPQIFCDVKLFYGYDYDKNYPTDHFFRNNFEQIIDSFLKQNEVISYNEYLGNIDANLKSMSDICRFFDGISPYEERYRWDLLQVFHLTLISFLNTYGYDFQHTTENQIDEIINSPRQSKLLKNLKTLIIRNKLDSNTVIKQMLKTNHFA